MSFPATIATGIAAAGLILSASGDVSSAQSPARPTIASEDDFRRAMTDLSNAGRWGKDDDKGTANFITAATRKQAAAVVKEGLAVSLAHPVVQDGEGVKFVRTLGAVRDTGTA